MTGRDSLIEFASDDHREGQVVARMVTFNAARDPMFQDQDGNGWVPIARFFEVVDALKRAAFVAEHLMQMIDRETWRATGGDDGQGHYEGDYREASTFEEIQTWKRIAG